MHKILKKPYVLTAHERWAGIARGFIAGVLVVVMGLTALWFFGTPSARASEAQHRTAMLTCKLPDVNGAMTVFVMEGGKIKCWRWR
jgi:hypothetical protein